LVTHYTGLSITKILVLGEKALFRLSEGAFLNDTSEGRELFNFLPSLLPISNKSDGTKAKPFTTKPFIGSFVSQTQHDDLTLWRMYGKEDKEEAKGCAITIDSQELLESLKNALTMNDKGETIQKLDEEFSFYRVAYRKSDKEKFVIPNAPEKEDTLNILMTDLYKRIEEFVVKNNQPAEIQNVVELLNRIAYLFKSFEYQYENEIRLVVNGIGFLKNINVDFIPPKVFINLVAIRPFIRRITLGPKVEKAEEWASAFYYSLDKEDLHPEILISHLPFK